MSFVLRSNDIDKYHLLTIDKDNKSMNNIKRKRLKLDAYTYRLDKRRDENILPSIVPNEHSIVIQANQFDDY